MFYDTHAHFDDGAFDADRDTLLPELYRQGITLINNIGCDVESSQNLSSWRSSIPLSMRWWEHGPATRVT